MGSNKSSMMSDQDEINRAISDAHQGEFDNALRSLMTMFNKGHVVVASNIAWCLSHKRPADIERAVEFYRIASDLGDEYSHHALGGIFRKRGDVEEAIKYYEKGAASANSFCQFSLYQIYKGKGQHGTANTYLHEAARNGSGFAVRDLALLYIRGERGVSNIPKGIYIYASNFGVILKDTRKFVDSEAKK